jgi:hypothetical protein
MNAENSPQANVNEMFSQAARVFQNAIEAGIRVQEQTTKTMSEIISGFNSPQKWQEQAQSTVEQMMASAEKGMHDVVELMSENTKTSLDLLEKAFEAQAAMAKGDGQGQTRELWETAIGSYLRNAEIMVQANSQMLESWRQMAEVLKSEPPKQAD